MHEQVKQNNQQLCSDEERKEWKLLRCKMNKLQEVLAENV